MNALRLPEISTYGEYSSGNYGVNSMRVDIGPLTVYYSYKTPVAFRVDGHSLVVHQNNWGPTTGKHLNKIDGGAKEKRVDYETFTRLWNEQVGPLLDAEAKEVLSTDNPALDKLEELLGILGKEASDYLYTAGVLSVEERERLSQLFAECADLREGTAV